MDFAKEVWMDFVDISCLSEEFKRLMKQLITDRFNRLVY